MATTIGNLAVKLSAQTSQFDQGMKGSQKVMGSVGGSVNSMVNKFLGIGAAIAASTLAFSSFSRAMDDVDRAAKVSDRLGDSIENITGLGHAASLAGSSADGLRAGLEAMAKSIGGVASGVAKRTGPAFDALGLSAEKLSQMLPSEAFVEVAEALKQVGTASERAAIAQKIFGGSGRELLNTLELGRAGLLEAKKEAEKLNLVYSRVDAAKIEKANDSITKMKSAFEALTTHLAIAFAPIITKITEFVTNFTALFVRLGDNSISSFVLRIGAIAASFTSVFFITGKVIGIMLSLKKTLDVLRTSFITLQALSGPKGWAQLAAGIAAAIGTVALLNQSLGDTDDTINKIVTEMEGLSESTDKVGKSIKTVDARDMFSVGEFTAFKKSQEDLNKLKVALSVGIITWQEYAQAVENVQLVIAGADGLEKRKEKINSTIDDIDEKLSDLGKTADPGVAAFLSESLGKITSELDDIALSADDAVESMTRLADLDFPSNAVPLFGGVEHIAELEKSGKTFREIVQSSVKDLIEVKNAGFDFDKAQKDLMKLDFALSSGAITLKEYARGVDNIDLEIADATGLTRQREEISSIIDTIDAKLSSLGKTDNEQLIDKFVGLGATTNQLDDLLGKLDEIANFEIGEKMKAEGGALFEATRTPLEKIRSEFERLDELLEAGAINWEVYVRATEDAQKRLNDIEGMKGQFQQIGLTEARDILRSQRETPIATTEALDRVGAKGKPQQIESKQIDRTNELLSRIEKNSFIARAA